MVIVLSAYIISLDVFFFVGGLFFPVFDENLILWVRIFIYVFMAINFFSVTFFFWATARNKFFFYKKPAFIFFGLLLFVTLSHLLMLGFEDVVGSYEELYNFQPHSIKTLVLLFALLFLMVVRYRKPSPAG